MDESNIPIEIHTLKMQDWLTSRKIIPKDAQKCIKEIRIKITNALEDMPSNEALIDLLSGKTIDYMVGKEIVEILKNTEKDTKSIFGRYGSQRMKDWQEILRLYEYNNVYLAEMAQIFVRNIKFEIPGIRKQISKVDQEEGDIEKQLATTAIQITQLKNEQTKLYNQLGIQGQNLRAEFETALCRLPTLLNESIKNIAKLEGAIKVYEDYAIQKECLPITRHLIKFGNTTVYWFIHKKPPLDVEEVPVQINMGTEPIHLGNDAAIDFGEEDAAIDFGEEDAAIDFGDEDAAIDFRDLGSVIDVVCDINNSNDPKDLDVNSDRPTAEFGTVVQSTTADGGTARGENALTILDSPSFRERFIDELYELEAFLLMRRYELDQLETLGNITFSLMDSFATDDADMVAKYLQNIMQVIQDVTGNDQIFHLHQLKHSPKYVILLSKRIHQTTEGVEKMHSKAELFKKRLADSKITRLDLIKALEELVTSTKLLQTQIEHVISQRYNNRDVHILGAIY